ncbi:FAD-dependent oxidoreductase [Pseudomonas sp. Teo4]|uniref:FAD-dependent oxidoreductase n=1 Tax=Pseudomonas sp. Teo4 TaxID=3064528 RepID=UPI002ABA61B8|nr:FAD-dependent oxidoreductase [Pseudomonas sp. Teo4]MDZ3992651.1 putative ferredoxin/ferredoxin--NADP reductase [Pseudomonas sp. Teo4]
MSARFPTIAIVGSGPSGCYVAQFLQKKWDGAQITIFEALPVPYGLVRYGVAADHQGSKAVIQQFERMFEKGGVEFCGNVTIGRDIAYTKLTESFDIVVLATGLNHDASLDIPVNPLAPVVGAGCVLKALNGHPRVNLPKAMDGTVRELGKNVAVIGSGNVAVDVLRMVAKTDFDLLGSDIADEIRLALNTQGVESLTLISRSSASDAKCDVSMMAELLSLPGLSIRVHGVGAHEQGYVAKLLQSVPEPASTDCKSSLLVNLMFNSVPKEVDEENGLAKLTIVDRLTGVGRKMEFETVVTAIGFNNGKKNQSTIPPEDLTGMNIYRVGWLKRGPKGTVAENRKDAKAVADQIVVDYESGLLGARKLGLTSIAHELPLGVVKHQGWRRIDQYEVRSASQGRCRKKITDVSGMLRVAGGDDAFDSASKVKEVVIQVS